MVEHPVRRDDSGIPSDPARVDETGRRPIRVIGLLLLLQAAGLAGVVLYELSRVDWRRLDPESPSARAIGAATSLLFAPPAVLALLAALGFLFLSRRGWILAALSQGTSLAICLWLYTETAPLYVYGVMVYCILMVLYLNSHDVRVVFHHPGREDVGPASGASSDD
ncbi:hypothetical protein GBA65_01480 [Rubrobacter marinus]|uniref:Uncharacterized protein n=1 Tax=Rubrobacter marinus TaxID=2653852 RepID=A0A6G8PT69_9ACTN|nr:hypothetical protein [Rubrobacter marinus]QIN77397.1 hypothetical protein GBA65_01480 [Rubrobacter marinus]